MPEERTTLSMSYGKTLLFVYNADSGVLPGMKDYSSKTGGSQGKDSCNLTVITHSPVGMKKDWKRFVKELGIPVRFMNRNEFVSEVGAGLITFPAILLNTGTDLLMVASSEEINLCRCLEDLINLLQARCANICGGHAKSQVSRPVLQGW